MSQLIHEIEESLRQERLATWWKEYGPYLIAGCILAVIFTAASATWRGRQQSVHERGMAAILHAEDTDNPAPALTQAAPQLGGGQRAIAMLTAAGLLADQDGQAPAAIKSYDSIVADTAIPEPFHSLAVLQDARLRLSQPNADGKTLLASLKPLIDDAKNPWNGEARVTSAVIAANLLHDDMQAVALLKPVMDDTNASESLKSRAFALSHVYQVEQKP